MEGNHRDTALASSQNYLKLHCMMKASSTYFWQAWPYIWGIYSSVSVKILSWRSSLNFPWRNFILFPLILSLVTRERSEPHSLLHPLSLLPVVVRSLLSLFFFKLNKVTSATFRGLALETILIISLWTHSSILMTLCCDTHSSSQNM